MDELETQSLSEINPPEVPDLMRTPMEELHWQLHENANGRTVGLRALSSFKLLFSEERRKTGFLSSFTALSVFLSGKTDAKFIQIDKVKKKGGGAHHAQEPTEQKRAKEPTKLHLT